MTDQNIPADKVQEIIDLMKGTIDNAQARDAVERARDVSTVYWMDLLTSLLPEPPRPTLADMTVEERRECRWTQADSEKWGRVIITDPSASGIQAGLLTQRGVTIYEKHTRVTPRPDLPRMEWPGNQKPSLDLPVGWRLADHPDHGRVIVTRATQGYVYFVYPNDALAGGGDWHYCDPAEMTYLDTPYIATTNRSSND